MGAYLSTDLLTTVFVTSLLGVQLLTEADPIGKTLRLFKQANFRSSLTCASDVQSGIEDYNKLHESEDAAGRNSNYKMLVNAYYDLATLFYEWGWGQSFHFTHKYDRFESSFDEAIRRHEYHLASMLGPLKTGSKVVDVGCGIGGPARNIARFYEKTVNISALTLNPYQVQRGNELCAEQNLDKQVTLYQGDFMEAPFDDNSFDAAYAIESTCHAPDRVGVYSEIYRMLKPGANFACYEWCITDKYDPTNKEHVQLKKLIEEGDGLPDIINTHQCLQALKEAGFKILHERDCALQLDNSKTNWHRPLCGSWNPFTQRFQFNWLGLILTNKAIALAEMLWLVPKGTSKTQKMLQKGGIGLARAGELGIFTPMYLMVGRKPSDSEKEQ